MIDSRASRAPMSPPETGASIACTPLRPARPRRSRPPAPARSCVMSTTTVPGFAPARDPLLAQSHLADVAGIADDREYHVRGLRHLADASRRPWPPSRPGPWSSRRSGCKPWPGSPPPSGGRTSTSPSPPCRSSRSASFPVRTRVPCAGSQTCRRKSSDALPRAGSGPSGDFAHLVLLRRIAPDLLHSFPRLRL